MDSNSREYIKQVIERFADMGWHHLTDEERWSGLAISLRCVAKQELEWLERGFRDDTSGGG